MKHILTISKLVRARLSSEGYRQSEWSDARLLPGISFVPKSDNARSTNGSTPTEGGDKSRILNCIGPYHPPKVNKEV